MADQTTNYELTKPLGDEKYDLKVFNENWDKIANQMKTNADGINEKQNTVKGAASTIVDANLTSSKVVVTDTTGKIAASDITSSELGHLKGLTKDVTTLVSEEASTRQSGDSALGERITTETDERKAGDSTLKTYIDGQITTVNGTINAKSGELATSISNEGTARSQADTNLQNQIDTKVPKTTTINGKALNGNITLAPGDIGAASTSAVQTAQSTADTAKSAATTAQNTANDGVNKANAAQSTANTAKATAEAALPKSGGTMSGPLTAQNNASYTTAQVRNVIISTSDPRASDGANGDIWIKYE